MTRILAIDDEKDILMLIKNALAKEGYDVTLLSDPLKIGELNLTAYQLILLDVMMPGQDGFSLCRDIRDQVDCPILFLTAKVQEADIMEGLGIGGDDYITKPFGIGELRARVAAHLRREGRQKKNAVSVGDVSLMNKAKQAVYEGKAQELPKREHAICEYPALKHGKVFSQDRKHEQVVG